MSKALVITEKNSVAEEIAVFLGVREKKKGYYESDDYIITWASGHLLRLGEPDEQNEVWKSWEIGNMPIFPTEYKYFPIERTKFQLSVIKNLIHRKDVAFLINAGDSDREGCLLQDMIYKYCGNRKPVKRLEFQSNSQKEIAKAWEQMHDENVTDRNMVEAGYCRQKEDWMDGMNYSRYYTIVYDTKPLSIGRLKMLILGMVRKRELDIQNFVPTNYYQLYANINNAFHTYWYCEDGNTFSSPEDAQAMSDKLKGKTGIVTVYETKQKKINPPSLYNLAGIQMDAVKKYGISSAETLEILERLYIEHKITTYPRSDAKTIKTDMRDEVPELINGIAQYYANNGKRGIAETAFTVMENGLNLGKHAINDKDIVSHHAIIVNENLATFTGTLTENEKRILDLIVKRMIISFSEPFIYDETTIVIEAEGETLKAIGKTPIQFGFKNIMCELSGNTVEENEEDGEEENYIPQLSVGEEVLVSDTTIDEKVTHPPKPYTEDTLIKDMETASKFIEDKDLKKILGDAKGIGTSATRGDTIKELIENRKYIQRGKNKNPVLTTTEAGQFLCVIVPQQLTKPDYTARVEYKLSLVENGELDQETFINDVQNEIVETINSSQYYDIEIPESLKKKSFNPEDNALGICPLCGQGYILQNKQGNRYYCNQYANGCTFGAFVEDKSYSFVAGKDKKITKTIMKSFLSKGSAKVDGKIINVEWYGKEYNGKQYHKFTKS